MRYQLNCAPRDGDSRKEIEGRDAQPRATFRRNLAASYDRAAQ